MYKLMKLAQNRFAVAIIGALFMSTILGGAFTSPQVASAGDTFGIDKVDKSTELGNEDLVTTVSDIIDVALGLLGIVAVVIILIGGFKYMTAGGNDEKVEDARSVIFSGIIGLAIILSAWAIARFVIESLSSATGSGDTPSL